MTPEQEIEEILGHDAAHSETTGILDHEQASKETDEILGHSEAEKETDAILGSSPTDPLAQGKALGNAVMTKAVLPATSLLGKVIDTMTLAAPLRSGMRAVQQGENPVKAAFEGAIHTRQDPWSEIIKNDPSFQKVTAGSVPRLPDETDDQWRERVAKLQGSTSKAAGTFADFAYPAQWGIHYGGLTRPGVAAKMEGTLPTTVGEQAEQGQRALMTVGDVPIIKGEPVFKGLSAAGDKLRGAFSSKTGITGYDLAKEAKLSSPEAYAKFKSDEMLAEDQKIIRDHAESMGIDPEELNKKINDYIEPPGSQMNDPEMVRINQEELGEELENLSPDIKAFADEKIAQYKGYQEAESAIPGREYAAREFYQKHLASPEWKDFVSKAFSEPSKAGGITKAPKSTAIPEQMSRALDKYTVNEINNLSQAGRGDEIFPSFPELKNFRGKIFNDNAAELAAHRYLQNAQVTSRNDFLQHVAKTYGKPMDAYFGMTKRGNVANEAGDLSVSTVPEVRDYTKWEKVSDPALPDGEMMFPTPIARDLKRIGQLSNLGKEANWVIKTAKTTSNFFKRMNYGIWPSSAAANWNSNQVLAMLGGVYDPMSQIQSMSIVQNAAARSFLNKPAVYSPKYGALTDREVWEAFNKFRAQGGGLTQADLLKPGNIVTQGGQNMQNFVEDSSRLGGFMAALQKGYTFEGAGKATRDTFLDYSAKGRADELLSPFIPFYSFQRRAIPAMTAKFFEEPGMFSVPQRLSEMSMRDEDKPYIEEWQRQSMPIFVGMSKDNQPLYFFGGNIWPQGVFNQFIGSGKDPIEMMKATPQKMLDYGMGALNPIPTTALELGTNRSFFSHLPVERFPGEKQPILGPLTGPAKLAYVLRKLRPFPEAQRFVDPQMPAAAAIGRAISGLNVRPIDIEKQELRTKMKPKFEADDLKRNLRLQAKYLVQANQKGDWMRAKVAKENIDILTKQLRELGESLEGVSSEK